MNNLGALYHSGNGVVGSVSLAVGWFVRAVLAGNSSAVCNLGLCFEEGTGVAKDWAQAEQLYREAAEAGNTTALCSLGYLYTLQEQYEAAARAFVLAAEQGHEDGQRGLRRLLQGGRAMKHRKTGRARSNLRSEAIAHTSGSSASSADGGGDGGPEEGGGSRTGGLQLSATAGAGALPTTPGAQKEAAEAARVAAAAATAEAAAAAEVAEAAVARAARAEQEAAFRRPHRWYAYRWSTHRTRTLFEVVATPPEVSSG